MKKFLFYLLIISSIGVGIALWVRAGATTMECEVVEEQFKGLTVQTVVPISASSTALNWAGDSKSDPAILGTSTTAYMSDPITKSFRVGEDADSFCMDIDWTASTTDAVLYGKFYASNNGTDWYAIDKANNTVTTTNSILDYSTTTVTIFPAGTTDTRSKHICLPQLQNLNTKWLRTDFSRGTNKSGGKLYAQGFIKSD